MYNFANLYKYKFVNIFTKLVKIIWKKKLDNGTQTGEAHVYRDLIKVAKIYGTTQCSKKNNEVTLWHEIVHHILKEGVHYQYSSANNNFGSTFPLWTDEQLVKIISNGIVQVLHTIREDK